MNSLLIFISLFLFIPYVSGAAPVHGAEKSPEQTSPTPRPLPESSPTDIFLHCAEKAEMATPFKICVYTASSNKITAVEDVAQGFNILKKIDSWMSDWRPETELSQVNAAAGVRAVRVSTDLFKILQYSLEVSRETDGAFDPTFNVFFGLYIFHRGHEREPREIEINERLPLINYKNVLLDRATQTVFLKKVGMKLGLGGIGQGYGVDEVTLYLQARGYKAGYVDGSGDTRFWGKKPDGTLWTVGIRDPRDKSKNIGKIYATDFSVTTAGDDEKYFMVGPRRVHHILDPKTGRPATASRQVTIISSTAVTADGFDDGIFVLGPKKGRAVLEKNGLAGIMVDGKSGDVTWTKNLKKKMTPWGEAFEITGPLKGRKLAGESESYGPQEIAPALQKATKPEDQKQVIIVPSEPVAPIPNAAPVPGGAK